MRRYIALLRGINVSGKNKLSMPELKKESQGLGFREVVTYLNSGNVIFSSELEGEELLSDKLRTMIKEKFGLDIPVLVILQEKLKEQLKQAPDWWKGTDKEIYNNLIFMMPPLSYETFCAAVGDLRAEYEKAHHHDTVIFWSFIRCDYQKTNWWSATANSNIKDKITIRTANTVTKIVNL